jgi:hypothetical protein
VVPEDVIVTAGKTVNILATGDETTDASATSGLFSTGLAGLAFGVGLSDADIKTEVNGQVTANQESGAVVKLEFDPTATNVIDFNNNSIDLAVALGNSTAKIPHALKTGDKVSYSNRRGNSIGGLGDGQDYYVVVDPTSPNKIYLAETLAKAKAAETKLKNGETLTPILLSNPASWFTGDIVGLTEKDFGFVNIALNTKSFDPSKTIKDSAITIDNTGGIPGLLDGQDYSISDFSLYGSTFELGQAVKYSSGGGTAIGGLENGKVYYVVASTNEKNLNGDNRFVGEQVIQLAETENKARAGVFIKLDPTQATGNSHSLQALHVLDSGLATGIGIKADLASSDSVSSEAGLGSQEFDPNKKDSKLESAQSTVSTSLGDRIFGALTKKFSGSTPTDRAQQQTGSSSKLSLAGSLAYLDTDHKVLSIVGDIDDETAGFDDAFANIESENDSSASQAKLQSKEDLEVTATITESMQLSAESTNEPQKAKDKDGKAVIKNQSGDAVDPNNPNIAASAAVIIGQHNNQAKAIVESGAILDAYRAMRVISDVSYPYLTRPDEFIPGSAGEFLDKVKTDGADAVLGYLDGSLGLKSLLNTWARSTAEADEGNDSVAGTVNYLDFDNVSKAIVRSGAQLNQDTTFRSGDGNETVSIEATNYMQMLNVTGVFDFSLPSLSISLLDLNAEAKKGSIGLSGSSKQRGGYGGALFIQNLKNTTISLVESGASIYTGGLGGLNMKAEEAILTFSFTQAGATGGDYGIGGSVGYLYQDSTTIAQLTSGVVVTSGTVTNENDVDGSPITIYAGSLETNINWAGGVATGRNLGFGIAVGINDITRNTSALIGNIDPDLDATNGSAPGTSTSITSTGAINVNAKVDGAIWAFTAAAAVAKDGESSEPTGNTQGSSAASGKDGTKFKYGVAISANASVNFVEDNVNAYIHDSGSIAAESITVQGLNQTDLFVLAFALSATLPTSQTTDPNGPKTATIAGSFSLNELKGTTGAYIKGKDTSDTPAHANKLQLKANGVSVSASRKGDIKAITAGIGVEAQKNGLSLGLAGSVSLNTITNTTDAFIIGVEDVTPSATTYDLSVTATDESAILAIAGALSIGLGGKNAGVGFSLATNEIGNNTTASIQDSTLNDLSSARVDHHQWSRYPGRDRIRSFSGIRGGR